jgi:hypothetical protein
MSNYHILDVTVQRNKARVAFHMSVPDETNSASPTPVNLRTALSEYNELYEVGISQVPNHATAFILENASLISGEVIEVVETMEFDANASNVAKLGIVESRWTGLNAVIGDEIRQRFKFWGYHGDV